MLFVESIHQLIFDIDGFLNSGYLYFFLEIKNNKKKRRLEKKGGNIIFKLKTNVNELKKPNIESLFM
jgi:3-deoxy-D-manno-octulosonate 8-phosphate phosphatase KdsC-like HAD superfamily phosphatase